MTISITPDKKNVKQSSTFSHPLYPHPEGWSFTGLTDKIAVSLSLRILVGITYLIVKRGDPIIWPPLIYLFAFSPSEH